LAAKIDIVVTQIVSIDEESDGRIAFHTPGELAALGCVAQVPVADHGFALMHFTGMNPDTRAQEVQRLEQEGRFNYWASQLLCEPDTASLSSSFSIQPDVALDDAYLEIARERWAVTRVPALGGQRDLDHAPLLVTHVSAVVREPHHTFFSKGFWWVAVQDAGELLPAGQALKHGLDLIVKATVSDADVR
jgi:hypothetical protein